MPSRRVFMQTLSLGEAETRWRQCLGSGEDRLTPAERVSTSEALHRVTAEPVFAAVSSPHYDAAAMDGIAVRAEDTFGARETNPVRLTIRRDAVFVNTGDPLPEGFDAVVKAEDLQQHDDGTVSVVAAVPPFQYVRTVGENVAATEMIVARGVCLRPEDLGALLSAKVTTVPVRRRPRVGIIPTGSEVVEPSAELRPGDVIESNSRMVSAWLHQLGAAPVRIEIVKDDPELLAAALAAQVREQDMVLVHAGAAGGTKDFTAEVVARLGEVVVHGVEIKPGKPVLLGLIEGKPVVNLPGYPVSTFVAFDLFVKPVICAMLGTEVPERPRLRARVARKMPSAVGVEEMVFVRLGRIGSGYVCRRSAKGASALVSLAQSDGLLRLPALSEGVEAGQEVVVELLRSQAQVDGALVAIGSHDLSLDLLSDLLSTRCPGRRVACVHVGSAAGLAALRSRETHVAGTHLLDAETGDYNVRFVRDLLPEEPVALVTVADREQGLMVPRGNPKALRSVEDLARSDVSIVNRQRGAGTRILLDYELERHGVARETVRGYGRELYTHLAVASAVAAGSADVALGILAAARAMNLDFIPVTTERYELAMLAETMEDERVALALEVLSSDAFKSRLSELGGYDVSRTSTVRRVGRESMKREEQNVKGER